MVAAAPRRVNPMFKCTGFSRSPREPRSAPQVLGTDACDTPVLLGHPIDLDARVILVTIKADGVLPALGGATAHADVRLDPLVVFASVGRRF